MKQWHSWSWGDWGRRLANSVIYWLISNSSVCTGSSSQSLMSIVETTCQKQVSHSRDTEQRQFLAQRDGHTGHSLSDRFLSSLPGQLWSDFIWKCCTDNGLQYTSWGCCFLPATEWAWEMYPVRQIDVSLQHQKEKSFTFTPTRRILHKS